MMLQKIDTRPRPRPVGLTIPLGVSDLAAGLAWLAILQNTGYLNSRALRARPHPTARVGWLSQRDAGHALRRHRARRGLARDRDRAGDPGRRPAADPEGIRRGRRDLRRDARGRKFCKITLPLLKPSLQSALILRTVLAFEVFAVVYALGGRNFPVLVGEAYVWQNENQNYGVAAAYAVLIMAISLAATRRLSRARCAREPEQQP